MLNIHTSKMHDVLDQTCLIVQVGLAGATRKANFAGPVRGAYTGLGAGRTANRPAGADLGNWSTTYSNSYEVYLKKQSNICLQCALRSQLLPFMSYPLSRLKQQMLQKV